MVDLEQIVAPLSILSATAAIWFIAQLVRIRRSIADDLRQFELRSKNERR